MKVLTLSPGVNNFSFSFSQTVLEMIKELKKLFLSFIFISFFISVYVFNNFLESSHPRSSRKTTCGRYPHEADILVDNIIWQVLEAQFGFVHLLNAYLDQRWNQTIVRVNVISPEIDVTTQKFYCQLWYDEKLPPSIVEATEFQSLWFNSKKPQFKLNNKLIKLFL